MKHSFWLGLAALGVILAAVTAVSILRPLRWMGTAPASISGGEQSADGPSERIVRPPTIVQPRDADPRGQAVSPADDSRWSSSEPDDSPLNLWPGDPRHRSSYTPATGIDGAFGSPWEGQPAPVVPWTFTPLDDVPTFPGSPADGNAPRHAPPSLPGDEYRTRPLTHPSPGNSPAAFEQDAYAP